MRMFACDSCKSPVYFENAQCLACGHTLGFLPDARCMAAIEPQDSAGNYRALAPAARGVMYRQCANAGKYNICNWMIPAGEKNPLCFSCRLVETIPCLDVPGNLKRWHDVELAKRRVIYTLLELCLPLEPETQTNMPGLRFAFVGGLPGQKPAVTSHNEGMITIDVLEADDDERERRRLALHEPYRTLIGHFRHEIGHYYWTRLISCSSWLDGFRKLFGDETRDYDSSLKAYYQQGPPADWNSRFVSAYASAHPWEDWAETWAHYLHMADTIETAREFGATVEPRGMDRGSLNGSGNSEFDQVLRGWFPLTRALNMLNRGMGLPDLYPFVLSDEAIKKLGFVSEVLRSEDAQAGGGSEATADALSRNDAVGS